MISPKDAIELGVKTPTLIRVRNYSSMEIQLGVTNES